MGSRVMPIATDGFARTARARLRGTARRRRMLLQRRRTGLPPLSDPVPPGIGACFKDTIRKDANQHRVGAAIPARARTGVMPTLGKVAVDGRRDPLVYEQVAGVHRMVVEAGDEMARLDTGSFDRTLGGHP